VKGLGVAAGMALLAAGIVALLAPLLVQAAGAPGAAMAEAKTYMDSGRAVIEEALAISPGFAVAYCAAFPEGAALTAVVQVLSGGTVNVWAMDRGDWELFKRGRPFHYYSGPSRSGTSGGTVSWSPPPGREACLVIDNSFSAFAPKDVRLRIEVGFGNETPAGEPAQALAYGREAGRPQPSRLAVLGAVLSITGLGLIAGSVANRAPQSNSKAPELG